MKRSEINKAILMAERNGRRTVLVEGNIDNQHIYRPKYHFTPQEGMMNDPNGLFYYEGEYHLYYQRDFGKAWGHAVSTDLVNWKYLSDALLMDDRFGVVASGSIVVDTSNSSGFGKNGNTPVVAIYTGWNEQVQCIAYSNDKGSTWTKYKENPVLEHANRDPKVFWHEDTKKWIMVLYYKDGASFFGSVNLKKWEKLSHISNDFFDCPDFFEMLVDDCSENKKWVLVSGDGAYMVGQFDGYIFTPETEVLQGDWGNPVFEQIRHTTECRPVQCNVYATQTWNNIPKNDGRRIQTAWMPMSYKIDPTAGFKGQHTFPCELTLRSTVQGIRLCRNPIKEICSIYDNSYMIESKTLKNMWTPLGVKGENVFENISEDALDIRISIRNETAREIGVTMLGETLSISTVHQSLVCMGRYMPIPIINGIIDIRILVDTMSLEIYANGGLNCMTLSVPFAQSGAKKSLYALGGSAHLVSAEIHEIKPCIGRVAT